MDIKKVVNDFSKSIDDKRYIRSRATSKVIGFVTEEVFEGFIRPNSIRRVNVKINNIKQGKL